MGRILLSGHWNCLTLVSYQSGGIDVSGISRLGRTQLFATGLLFAMTFCGPADARHWLQTPIKLAQDYAQIIDTHPNGEAVFIQWYAAPAFPAVNERGMLDEYVILAVVHGRLGDAGEAVVVDPISTLTVIDAAGKVLEQLPDDSLPPDVASFAASMKQTAMLSLGQLGGGMKAFVFKAGSVRACKPGKVSIPLAGQVYTYDTPFPGCTAG